MAIVGLRMAFAALFLCSAVATTVGQKLNQYPGIFDDSAYISHDASSNGSPTQVYGARIPMLRRYVRDQMVFAQDSVFTMVTSLKQEIKTMVTTAARWLLSIAAFTLSTISQAGMAAESLSERLELKEKAIVQDNTTIEVPRCTEKHLQNVEGFLIDLDGTVYNDRGILPGAQGFYEWMYESDPPVPYVLLSNSGGKGSVGTQAKLSRSPYTIRREYSRRTPDAVPLENIHTGAMAAADFLLESALPNARLYVLQSISRYGNLTDSFTRVLRRRAQVYDKVSLVNSWDIRTDLTEDEARFWAREAISLPANTTFVVLTADGDVYDDADDSQSHSEGSLRTSPLDGLPAYTTWDYNMIKKAVWLVSNGATFVCHARDTHNPKLAAEPGFYGVDLMLPGPGTFEALIRSATYPKSKGRLYNTGKGGNAGTTFMMETAVRKLQDQGMISEKRGAVMIGDTLDTDIKGANDFGIRSILLRSGVHSEEDFQHYPDIRPTCVLDDIGELAQILSKEQPEDLLAKLQSYTRAEDRGLPLGEDDDISSSSSTLEQDATI
mmetsp:Transcript_8713/g.13008  ORF Transcript_8713/g.13008 Transcript_8713/m.13008 type:complete len:551 (-) Transcript_8713:240-1892(-)|eukprot:CAMPEP_0167757244 /NCGR_PEP_ID=MMETSP0110_2-20121227/9818_1 /TAXON_ID=629695 /ORGANISM="Gymnochlora sp., Strain CCMP2014" /LENGTH=550 /DNA_ID=CAMNT_0007643413 /DNA_START=39 /DNA_END=1691 /DNA_ORIENTATION=-